MTVKINPPPRARLPKEFVSNPAIRAWTEQIQTITFQLYNQTSTDNEEIVSLIARVDSVEQQVLIVEQAIEGVIVDIGDINDQIAVINNEIIAINNTIASITLDNRVIVKSSADLSGELDSTKQYFIDGIIDMTGVEITVPSGGLNLYGYNFDISQLVCADNNYTLLNATSGGNLVMHNFSVEVSGTSSKVYDLTPSDPNNAIEVISVNFNNCTSLGEVKGYRQYFESGTGRFGGTPELTFSGSMNGVRVSSSIVRGVSNFTSLFKAGTALEISGRFFSDINVDLPAVGALIDFSESNILNDESLEFVGAYVTRQGALDPTDTTIYPNITNDSVKSEWKSNTGIPNTHKYFKSTCTTEVPTTISAANTYYPLEGTITVDNDVHFDMPANGEFRALTGFGAFTISANLVIEGTSNDEVGLRMTKSTDDGATWPTEVNHISRTINSLSGPRDVAFLPVNFITTLAKGDRLRFEVENKTGTDDVTMELDSYFIISEV